MNSIKIKLSLIANLIAIFALIVLGIVSFYFTKTSLHESALKNQTDLLKVTQSTVEDFRSTNQSFTRALEKDITNLPYQSLITEENIINNVGPILKYYRHSINALNVYLGLNNGKVLLSQKSNDAKMPELRDDLDIKTKDWYQEALKTNDIFVTPAYLDTNLKQYVITYSKAIYKDGKIIGVLGVDIPSEDLQNLVAKTPGNTFLFDQKNKIFAATNKELLNPSIDHSPVLNAYKTHGDYNFFTYGLDGKERLGTCTKVFAYTACITESADIINKPIHKAAFIQAIVVIIVVVFSVILLYFIVSKYLSPLAAIQTGLTSFFDFINHKTKNVSTIEVKSNDEFGQISSAINENILATKRGLEQDNQAVKESVETVSVVESLFVFVFGICCILSLNLNFFSMFSFFGKDFFTLLDKLTSNFLLPLGAIVCSIFVGFFMNKKQIYKIFSKFISRKIFLIWLFFIRFISPIAIILVMCYQIFV